MANTKLSFFGANGSDTEDHRLECFANHNNHIFISIEEEGILPGHICLDISTSIKLAKTLRTEINKIKEGKNG